MLLPIPHDSKLQVRRHEECFNLRAIDIWYRDRRSGRRKAASFRHIYGGIDLGLSRFESVTWSV